MKMHLMITALALSVSIAFASSPTNVPSAPGSITVQEMLVSGPTQLKMHSLMMIQQGNIKGSVDDSYLPGLSTCAQHKDALLRSISARILGEHFVRGRSQPNSQAISLLETLAQDDAEDVRYNAVYYGLSQTTPMTPEIAELLIDAVARDRAEGLLDRVVVALANYKPQVVEILNRKLNGENAIAYFEIYEELTGSNPPGEERFIDQPSSRPYLFVINTEIAPGENAKDAFLKQAASAGIKSTDVRIPGSGDKDTLLFITYLTGDRLAAENFIKNSTDVTRTQSMWLTPELEVQLQTIRDN